MSKTNENRQLLIMRHGKSDWEMDIDDMQRPLKKRGEEEASNVGHWLDDQGLQPDMIISSPARRALATSQQVADIVGITGIEQDERIYDNTVSQLLAVLADIPAEVKRPMIVGHNPGFEGLLLHLAEVDAKFYKDGSLFTTGTVAVLNMPDDWQQLDRHCAELLDFARGKDI
ncbi:histidine phosphatase family protein [Pseudomonadota bacterium]